MNLDMGPIGKIIGYAIGLILLGALATTGIGVLVGRGIVQTPQFIGDIYFGMTGKEMVIDPDFEVFGLHPVTKDMKLFGMIALDKPIVVNRSGGSRALNGEGEGDGESGGGTDWDTSNVDNTEGGSEGGGDEGDGGGSEGGGDGGGEAAGPSADCRRASVKLISLKGVGDPYQVRDAANAVLGFCTDDENIAEATAALTAAERTIAEEEAKKKAHDEKIVMWNIARDQLAKAAPTNYAGIRDLILAVRPDGMIYLDSIEGLFPGVARNIAGGAEVTKLYVYPPEDIRDEVDYITVNTELGALWSWGLGCSNCGTLGIANVPETGKEYSIAEPR